MAKSSALPSNADVKSSTSLDELEAWETIARERAGFCGTALKCIEYHLKHFEAAADLTNALPKGLGPTELAMKARKADAVVKRALLLVCSSLVL